MRASFFCHLFFAAAFFVLFSECLQADEDTKSKRIVPVLPAHIMCEPDEDIFFYSQLGDEALWALFPASLGAVSGGKIRGGTEGNGWLCGKSGGKISIARVTIKKLTPADSEIITGLRRELTGSNVFKNHYDAAEKEIILARSKMHGFQSRFTDLDIRAKALRGKCGSEFEVVLSRLTALSSATVKLKLALRAHSDLARDLRMPETSRKTANPKLALPPGYIIGKLIIYPDEVLIYDLGDWEKLTKFEIENRVKLEPGYADAMGASETLDLAAADFDAAVESYLSSLYELISVFEEQDALPALVINAQSDLDSARQAKLSALFGEKEHKRKVEELELWYQFRRWLATRTNVSSAASPKLFAVRTDEFKLRLQEYRKELLGSLSTIEKLEESAPAALPVMPDAPSLPGYLPNRDAINTSGVFALNALGQIVQIRVAENTFGAYVSRLGALDAESGAVRLAVFESGIVPPGIYTGAGEFKANLKTSEIAALPDLQTNTAKTGGRKTGMESFTYAFHSIVPEIPRVRGVNLHEANAALNIERSSVYKHFLADISRYERGSSAWVEAETAVKYRPAVQASLSALDTVIGYLDWRLDYVALVHGGAYNRQMALATIEKEWTERMKGHPECTRENIADIYNSLFRMHSDGVAPTTAVIIDFLFPKTDINAN